MKHPELFDLQALDKTFFRQVIAADSLNNVLGTLAKSGHLQPMRAFIETTREIVERAEQALALPSHLREPDHLRDIEWAAALYEALDHTHLSESSVLGTSTTATILAEFLAPVAQNQSEQEACAVQDYLLDAAAALAQLDACNKKIYSNAPTIHQKAFVLAALCATEDVDCVASLVGGGLNLKTSQCVTNIRTIPHGSKRFSDRYYASFESPPMTLPEIIAFDGSPAGLHYLLRGAGSRAAVERELADKTALYFLRGSWGVKSWFNREHEQVMQNNLYIGLRKEAASGRDMRRFSYANFVRDIYENASPAVAGMFLASLLIHSIDLDQKAKRPGESDCFEFLWDLGKADLLTKLKAMDTPNVAGHTQGHEEVVCDILTQCFMQAHPVMAAHFSGYIMQMSEIWARRGHRMHESRPEKLLLNVLYNGKRAVNISDFARCVDLIMSHGHGYRNLDPVKGGGNLLHQVARCSSPMKIEVMVLLAQRCPLDLEKKDDRGWKPASHLSPDDREALRAMLNADNARRRAQDALLEIDAACDSATSSTRKAAKKA